MRILYLTQYYPPEIGATQIRAAEMTAGLARAGHRVTVITEVPNHPHGVIHPAYRGRLFFRQETEGVEVLRLWVSAAPQKTFRTRMQFYLSFMLGAIGAGLFLTRGRFDGLVASSPPLFVGAAALVISYLRRLPLVFEVRDLWPESAVQLGELRNRRAIRWATRLEEWCYRRAGRVVVTAQEIVERLVERGVPPHKIALVRNGSNTRLFYPNPGAGQTVRERLGLQGRFVVLYAGLHGLAYDLDGLLDVAAALQTEADIHVLLVGDGPTKAQLARRARDMNLPNVTLLPAQPPQAIPDYFNAADVSVAPMKTPHIVGTLPVKIYDSMACGVPVIVAATGEASAVVRDSGGGLVVPPANGPALRAAILRLRDDPHLRAQLGRSGQQAVAAHYSRQAQARQLVALLSQTFGHSPG